MTNYQLFLEKVRSLYVKIKLNQAFITKKKHKIVGILQFSTKKLYKMVKVRIFYQNLIPTLKKRIHIIFLILVLTITTLVTSNYNVGKRLEKENIHELFDNVFFKKTFNNIFSKLEQRYKIYNHTVASGETFAKILKEYSISTNDINGITRLLSEDVNLSKLTTGEKIQIRIDQSQKKVQKLIFPITKTKKIMLFREDLNDDFKKKKIITKLTKKILYKENIIKKSLYSSAIEENIPANIIIEFANIYGFQIDFQRDIQKRDTFQILYETFENEQERVTETGKIIYANLILNGQDNSLYYFKDKRDDEGHYDKNGKSVKKALMKTPINGARLSSPFGMRKHPIDGYNKMHQGTDFAAPEGTPIMASGNGIIKKVGWCGGGGNCVKIKHNNTYSTVYAHMSKFGRGIKIGVRVRQGQIIGYVGSTGKSTGPHLHYEVIQNGKKINSQKLKLPSGKILRNEDRIDFETKKIKIDVLKSEKIMGIN